LSEFDISTWLKTIAKGINVTEINSEQWLINLVQNVNDSLNNPCIVSPTSEEQQLFSTCDDKLVASDATLLIYFILSLTQNLRVNLGKNSLMVLYQGVVSNIKLLDNQFVSLLAILTQLKFEEKCESRISQLLYGVIPAGVSHTTLSSRFHELVKMIGTLKDHIFLGNKDVMLTADNCSPNYKPSSCENK
jgi:hypothetical protein